MEGSALESQGGVPVLPAGGLHTASSAQSHHARPQGYAIQCLSCKLGVATGKHLAQHCRCEQLGFGLQCRLHC